MKIKVGKEEFELVARREEVYDTAKNKTSSETYFVLKPIEPQNKPKQEYYLLFGFTSPKKRIDLVKEYIEITEPTAEAIAEAIKELLEVIQSPGNGVMEKYPPVHLHNLIDKARTLFNSEEEV